MLDISKTIQLELIGDINFYLGLGIQVMAAIILGGLIGVDRELKQKAAGMKTHMLICLGATIYTIMSVLTAELTPTADPARMSSQIVSGIGFLGAGAILQGRQGISGLTTAATIWIVAAIGVSIGSGYPFSAFLFTTTIMVVLKLIDPLYRFLGATVDYHLQIVLKGDDSIQISSLIDSDKYTLHHYRDFVDEENHQCVLNYYININQKDLRLLINKIRSITSVRKMNYTKLTRLPDFREFEDR